MISDDELFHGEHFYVNNIEENNFGRNIIYWKNGGPNNHCNGLKYCPCKYELQHTGKIEDQQLINNMLQTIKKILPDIKFRFAFKNQTYNKYIDNSTWQIKNDPNITYISNDYLFVYTNYNFIIDIGSIFNKSKCKFDWDKLTGSGSGTSLEKAASERRVLEKIKVVNIFYIIFPTYELRKKITKTWDIQTIKQLNEYSSNNLILPLTEDILKKEILPEVYAEYFYEVSQDKSNHIKLHEFLMNTSTYSKVQETTLYINTLNAEHNDTVTALDEAHDNVLDLLQKQHTTKLAKKNEYIKTIQDKNNQAQNNLLDLQMTYNTLKTKYANETDLRNKLQMRYEALYNSTKQTNNEDFVGVP